MPKAAVQIDEEQLDQWLANNSQLLRDNPDLAPAPAAALAPDPAPDLVKQPAPAPEPGPLASAIADTPIEDAAEAVRSRADRLGAIVRESTAWAELQARRAQDRLAATPTPGGIGPLLFAIFVFLAAIVPVSAQGKTRAELLWLTLTNRTQLSGRREVAQGFGASPLEPGQGSGGGSSGFGATYTTETSRPQAVLIDFTEL